MSVENRRRPRNLDKTTSPPQPSVGTPQVRSNPSAMEKENSKSLPVSRGSVVDSELSRLIHEFPDDTDRYLKGLFDVDTRRYKRNPEEQAAKLAEAAKHPRGKLEEKTHYMETYIKKPIRPRSNKRPPPERRDPNPPAMTFDTWQRESYKPLEPQERVAPIKIKDNYDVSQDPVNEHTVYQSDYPPKFGERLYVNPPIPETTRRKGDNSTFYGVTTSKEAFKNYQLPQRPNHFQELPTFTGSIIYPSQQHEAQTTMQAAFQGQQSQRLQLFKGMDPTLRPEGQHDFLTVTKDSYKGHYDVNGRVKPVNQAANLRLDHKEKLHGETQFMADFPGFKAGQPRPPNPILPAKGTIDLKYDSNRSFDTEQRQTFRGHDVKANPVPKPFCKDAKEYVAPTERFATQTVTQNDFQPIHLGEAFPVSSSKPALGNQVLPNAKEALFGGITTSQEFFKEWKPAMPHRHGDFHMSYSWVPPVHKLAGLSETKQTYIAPANPQRVVSLKPLTKPVASQGLQDFDTVYNRTFRPRDRVHLSHQQADILKRQLKEKKMARLASRQEVSGGRSVAVH